MLGEGTGRSNKERTNEIKQGEKGGNKREKEQHTLIIS
jgi:hypothetical protein